MEKLEFTNIDEYIKCFSKDIQEILQRTREAIKQAAPEAKEVISYSMPAFKQNRVLVYFAAAKKHLGFYPTGSGIKAFEEDLTEYVHSKGAVQFPYNKPIPYDLIEKITKYKVNEDFLSSKKK